MKTTVWSIIFLLLFSQAGVLFGKQEQVAVPAGNPYDYFKLGEIAFSLNDVYYYNQFGDKMKQKLAEYSTLMKKLGVSTQSLAAYDSLSSVVLGLPFGKEDYSKWTKENQERWSKEGQEKATALWNLLKTDVGKDPNGYFFYLLGSTSLELAWYVPQDIRIGLKISDTSVKQDLVNFVWLRDQKTVESLTPVVAAAVKDIAAMQEKLNDPLEGLSKEDITKMAESAQSIRDAAKEKTLVRE